MKMVGKEGREEGGKEYGGKIEERGRRGREGNGW
jgi:hypothetical protein